MKALIATPYYYPRHGGMENYARHIAQGLRASGCEVVVVCGDTTVKQVTREALDGYTVYRLPIWKVVSNTPVNLGWFGMLRKIIRTERPDVINVHTPVPFMVDVITWAAGRVPVVVTYHAATLFKPSSWLMSLVTRAYMVVQMATLARASEIIAVSPYVKTALGRRWADKIRVVTNAVPAAAAARTGRGQGLVFVNNLEPAHSWKGLDLILDALAMLVQQDGQAPQLTVVGDGSDRPRYERRVRELGLSECVQFAGAKRDAARDELVRQAAAMLVYSTTGNDAFPTVLLEGWQEGAAVIAADIGPLPSIVTDGENGVLVEANNAEALAKVIRDLLSNPAHVAAMGEAGRKLVAKEYTWPRQVARTKAILEELA